MLTAFYILIALEILLGFASLWEGLGWRRMVRKRLATPLGFYSPRVALLCPCKGAEPGLEENLAALVQLDYSNYEVFFVLATANDPVRDVVEHVVAKSKRPARVVIAGPPRDCSEKVNNLRVALEHVGEEFEVLVFADSDGRPGRRWLRHLVAPLADARLGASTTFRWYVPERGGFWSALASAWNAPIVTLLGEHGRNFCWGGGTAIRRKVFEEVHALDYWKGAVSDDYALTRALKGNRRHIHFVPECLVPTLHDTTARGFFEFTNRQIIITRVYSPGLWALSMLSQLVYCGAIFCGLVLLFEAWLGVATWSGLPIVLLMLLVALLAAAKGYLRLSAVGELLLEWKNRLLAYSWAWTLLAAVVPFFYLWSSLVAIGRRRITWRGITYELVSPDQTRILSR